MVWRGSVAPVILGAKLGIGAPVCLPLIGGGSGVDNLWCSAGVRIV